MPATRLPIIGYPLARTALEGVLRTALAEAGSPIQIEQREARPHQLADALKEVRDGDDFVGALIASPHKEKAPPLSDWLSDDARLSGAVNVLARIDGRLRGYNSDLDGVRAGLTSILPRVKGRVAAQRGRARRRRRGASGRCGAHRRWLPARRRL